ncbi:MAG TPA: biotin/lipoyl-containing protein [Nitrososphaerales archaeon]|nr:biotin/lipoyl-containing protein [Nitrososphaerales archaeon]
MDGPDGPISVEVTKSKEVFEVVTDGHSYKIRLNPSGDPTPLVSDSSGRPVKVSLGDAGSQRVELRVGDELLAYSRRRTTTPMATARSPVQVSKDFLTSPMPGKVMSILAKKGAKVPVKAALVVIESMKMETAVRSDRDGTVDEVLVRVGSVVKRGQPLLKFET